MIFCFQTTFLILATTHEVDLSFLIINLLSIPVFFTTAFFLYKFYYSNTHYILLIIVLIITLLIFGYYTYDIFSKADTKTLLAYQPLFGLLVGFLFFMNVIYSIKNKLL